MHQDDLKNSIISYFSSNNLYSIYPISMILGNCPFVKDDHIPHLCLQCAGQDLHGPAVCGRGAVRAGPGGQSRLRTGWTRLNTAGREQVAYKDNLDCLLEHETSEVFARFYCF